MCRSSCSTTKTVCSFIFFVCVCVCMNVDRAETVNVSDLINGYMRKCVVYPGKER